MIATNRLKGMLQIKISIDPLKIFCLSICLLVFLSLQFSAQAQPFVKTKISKNSGATSESYQSMTFNGAWCWFSDPRAVYHEGQFRRTYSGWVDNYGDIHVGYYDHDTKEITSKVIYDNLEIDDHDNPSLLFDEDGKLLVFFNTHTMGPQPLYLAKAKLPESIEEWEPTKELLLNDPAFKGKMSFTQTYTNPIKLSSEDGRIYLFWRGVDGKPSYSTSDDNGETWSVGKVFFKPDPIYSFRRPYTKIYSDGVDKIHFTVTDGHPRKENENSIYYFYLKEGVFYKADGSKIKALGNDPITPAETDLVYDASIGKSKSWNWDIAQFDDGKPVIAYAKFPNDSSHIYARAYWDGSKWVNQDLINSGGWFPQTPEGVEELEPNYSGGLNIDHEDPNIMYLSVKREQFFEIEKWTTKNSGKSWKVEELTKDSKKDNIRPFAVRNAKAGNQLQVMWMQNSIYHHFGIKHLKRFGKGFNDRYHTSIKMNIASPEIKDPLNQASIIDIMRQTADWQLSNPRYEHKMQMPINWHYAALYTGLRSLHELTGEDRYKAEMINIGQANNWKPDDDIFHADRLAIIDNWAWLYGMEQDPDMIEKSQWALDIHLAQPYEKNTDVRYKGSPHKDEWWSWCDALFMAPPSFVQMWKVTGETKYLDYMSTQWWKTSEYLYSKEDSLYFRDDRYFDRRSDNGTKIFWSRGNGWVLAGLSRILSKLPADFPSRGKFEQQYQEMATKLLSLQDEDGMWRVSLIDPEYLDMGESSGSAFYTYGLAWGINNGLIDKKYQPAVEKAWKALCNNVNKEGRLGYVQQVAGDPYPFKAEESHVYATGAFLLAGKEIYKMQDSK
ncbi:MAG: glycoside hydrolase family 88 protein [Cyclobacteriaceae bacterium]